MRVGCDPGVDMGKYGASVSTIRSDGSRLSYRDHTARGSVSNGRQVRRSAWKVSVLFKVPYQSLRIRDEVESKKNIRLPSWS